jgi:hypothetical protein
MKFVVSGRLPCEVLGPGPKPLRMPSPCPAAWVGQRVGMLGHVGSMPPSPTGWLSGPPLAVVNSEYAVLPPAPACRPEEASAQVPCWQGSIVMTNCCCCCRCHRCCCGVLPAPCLCCWQFPRLADEEALPPSLLLLLPACRPPRTAQRSTHQLKRPCPPVNETAWLRYTLLAGHASPSRNTAKTG